jgi:hypothetical protein
MSHSDVAPKVTNGCTGILTINCTHFSNHGKVLSPFLSVLFRNDGGHSCQHFSVVLTGQRDPGQVATS